VTNVFELSVLLLAFTAVVMIFAGLVHGTLGLGFPLMATPLLALFLDLKIAILLTLLPTAVVNVASILHGGNWRTSAKLYWHLPVFSLFGGALGSFLIAKFDPAPFQLLLALLIVLYLMSAKFNPNTVGLFSENRYWIKPLVGLTAGFAAGTTNVMVPILIIYALSINLQKNTMVQVFNMSFLAGKLAQITVFGLTGTINTYFLLSTVPFAVLGYGALLLGKKKRDTIPTDTFRTLIRHLLLCFAILLSLRFIITQFF